MEESTLEKNEKMHTGEIKEGTQEDKNEDCSIIYWTSDDRLIATSTPVKGKPN